MAPSGSRLRIILAIALGLPLLVQALVPGGVAFAPSVATAAGDEGGSSAFTLTLGDGGVPTDVDVTAGGYPNDNTLGWTTDHSSMDRDFYDTEGAVTVPLDMGQLNNKHLIRNADGYKLTLDLGATAYYWYDGDGRFDPVNGDHNGYGDDPCPNDPFPVFDVKVNGVLVHTYEGENAFGCEPGGPENSRSFRFIKPSDDDPLNVVRVPVDAVNAGDGNTVTIRPYDYTLPAYMWLHSKSADGWIVNVKSVQLELVAAPLVIAHGWTKEWDPEEHNPTPEAWQTSTLPNKMRSAFQDAYGQDPWAWAGEGDGTHAFAYDRKQDIRDTAGELGRFVRDVKSEHGYDGKIWIAAHSMGGLVSRWYLEMMNGNAHVEMLAQMGTPNLGSWMADAYTAWNFLKYEAWDEDYTAEIICDIHYEAPDPCLLPRARTGWRDWWERDIGAFQWENGFGHGRDRLADFSLKPERNNPFTSSWRASAFPAPGVEYFCVYGDDWGGLLTHLFDGGGDGVVGFSSATMDGKIDCERILFASHTQLTTSTDTAKHFVKYFSGERKAEAEGSSVNAAASVTSAATAPATTAALVRDVDVPADGSPVSVEFTLEAAPSATLIAWSASAEPALQVTVVAPDGSRSTPTLPQDGVTFFEYGSGVLHARGVNVTTPAAGTWALEVQRGLAGDESVPVRVIPLVRDSFKLAAWTAEDHVAPGADVTLHARVTDAADAVVTGATVTASYEDANGDDVTVPLLDADGDGTFSGGFATPATSGALHVDVIAEGADWVRTHPLELVVATFPDLVVTDVTTTPDDAWGGDAVTLGVVVENAGEGATRSSASVTFTAGDPGTGAPVLATATVPAGLAPGERVTLTADAIAPNDAVTLVASVARDMVELSYTNNDASSAAPFVPHPRTAAFFTGVEGANGWFHDTVTVTLGPFDGSAPTTDATYYSVNDAPARLYEGPFTLDEDGTFDLAFWSVTANGRTEPARAASVGIDGAAPTGVLTRPVDGHLNVADQSVPNPFGFTALAGAVVLEAAATDATSGVARVTFLVNGVPLADAVRADGNAWALEWDTTDVPIGNHVLAFELEDAAGHVTRSDDVPVYVVGYRSGPMTPANDFITRVRPPMEDPTTG